MVLIGFRRRVSWLAQRFMSLVPFPTQLGRSCADDMAHMIRAARTKQKEIQGEGGGTDITVAEDESSEQSGLGAICGIVEVAIAIDHEDEHVSISQIGA
jgi:hypothetical protein